jgi:hypothetical protein
LSFAGKDLQFDHHAHVKSRISELLSAGKSNKDVADVLNAEGIKTPSGKTWSASNVWGFTQRQKPRKRSA